MKYSLFLLAVMVGTVCGAELGARIEGVTLSGPFCTAEQQDELYEECVVDMFVSMGGVLDRRLDLRGGARILPHCSQCTEQMSGARGHWCFYHCGGNNRRLTIADALVSKGQLLTIVGELVSKGQLEQAAYACLVPKIEDDYECLGNPEDLKVKIFLSE
jgi:hypothetical protein